MPRSVRPVFWLGRAGGARRNGPINDADASLTSTRISNVRTDSRSSTPTYWRCGTQRVRWLALHAGHGGKYRRRELSGAVLPEPPRTADHRTLRPPAHPYTDLERPPRRLVAQPQTPRPRSGRRRPPSLAARSPRQLLATPPHGRASFGAVQDARTLPRPVSTTAHDRTAVRVSHAG
jgi:hypothetical protein